MLTFSECVSRYAESDIQQAAIQYLTTYDPDLGWSKLPNERRVHKTHEYESVEETNSQALRGPEIPIERTPGRPRVLMLGDSFLEGVAVREDKLVSTVVQRSLSNAVGAEVEVVNGGTVGYSTDQELLFYRLQGRAYSPDVTVLLFYVNDVWFNAQPRYWRGEKPQFVMDDGELRLTNTPVPKRSRDYLFAVAGGSGVRRAFRRADAWLGLRSAFYRLGRKAALSVPFIRRAAISSGFGDVPGERKPWRREPTPQLEEALQMTAAILMQLRDEVESDGSRFVIYHVPSRAAIYPEDWREISRASAMSDAEWNPEQDGLWLREFCRLSDLDCIVDFESFRAEAGTLDEQDTALYFAQDTHWTARGHALAGRLIAERLIDGGLLSPKANESASVD